MSDDIIERLARRFALRLSGKRCGPDHIQIVRLVRADRKYYALARDAVRTIADTLVEQAADDEAHRPLRSRLRRSRL